MLFNISQNIALTRAVYFSKIISLPYIRGRFHRTNSFSAILTL